MKHWASISCFIFALLNVPFFTLWFNSASYVNVIAFFFCLAVSLFCLNSEITMSKYNK